MHRTSRRFPLASLLPCLLASIVSACVGVEEGGFGFGDGWGPQPGIDGTSGDDGPGGEDGTGEGSAGSDSHGTESGTDGGADTGGGDGAACGNGVLEEDEECDTNDFGGQTCEDFGFTGGELGCNVTCTIATTGCYVCGDGSIATAEVCDGANLGGEDCISQGFDAGVLACNDTCDGFVTDACTACGDGTIAGDETCEGSDFGGEDCASQGFDDGDLSCASCQIDTTGCHLCGDGELEGPEVCDCDGSCSSSQLGGASCEDFAAPAGGSFNGGTLGCAEACDAYVTDACTYCGDGARNGDEQCEGADLGGETCTSIGFADGGVLACAADGCRYDMSGCLGEQCGGDPRGEGACPAECTGGCADGICTIDCTSFYTNDPNNCKGDTVNCPDDWPCVVNCDSASGGCDDATINCGDLPCTVHCISWSCDDTIVNCRFQQCTATCYSSNSEPTLNCNDSCNCQPC